MWDFVLLLLHSASSSISPAPHHPVMIVDSRVTMDQSTYLQRRCNHLIHLADELDADFGVYDAHTDLEGVREVAWPYSEVDETERVVSAGR